MPPFIPLAEIQLDLFGFIKAMTSHALFRGTVPMLTCISGYLVFKAGYHLNFYNLVSKKTKTILVPLILWNLPIMIALYILQKYSMINHDFSVQAYPLTMDNWIDGVIGWRSSTVNYPLNFLRNLFIVSMLAPIFGIMIRFSPYIGLLVVSVFFLNNLDGEVVLRDTMAVNFYIAGMAALLSWDLRKIDRAWPICAVFLVILCVLIVALRIENRVWFILICPFLIWPIVSSFQDSWIGTKLAKLSKASFVIFFESWSRRVSDVGNIQQGWAAMALRLVLGDLPLGCNRLRAYDSVGGLPVGTHSCKRHDGEPIKAEMPTEYP